MHRTRSPPRFDVTALRGWGQLAIDGTVGLTDVVEAMHHEISTPFPLRRRPDARTRGITGLVYRGIRGTARLVGVAYEAALDQLAPPADGLNTVRRSEAVLAVLNGVAGDYLAATGNPLAIEMALRREGRALVLERGALADQVPDARRKVVVLVHGSCMHDLGWVREGHDHGAALERDLGYTALYLHYNSGLHISTNGHLLSAMLEELVRAWPVPLESIVLVGHSMGGLVMRSAYHDAAASALRWPHRLEACFFLGTPHLGAPLERGGHLLHTMLRISRYSAPIARLGGIRSAGVTDMRHASVLDEDWKGRDRFAHRSRKPRRVPLPEGVRCFAIAGCMPRAATLAGDGLVPVRSALGIHRDSSRALRFPEAHRFIARGVGHIALLGDRGVYEFMKQALERR